MDSAPATSPDGPATDRSAGPADSSERFSARLGRRATPVVRTAGAAALPRSPGRLAGRIGTFGQRLGLSQTARWTLDAADGAPSDTSTVRPPINYWPWDEADPVSHVAASGSASSTTSPAQVAQDDGFVPTGDARLDALRRMMHQPKATPRAARATRPETASRPAVVRPRRGLPQALHRTGTAGRRARPGDIARRLEPNPVDPRSVPTRPATGAVPANLPAAAAQARTQPARASLDQPAAAPATTVRRMPEAQPAEERRTEAPNRTKVVGLGKDFPSGPVLPPWLANNNGGTAASSAAPASNPTPTAASAPAPVTSHDPAAPPVRRAVDLAERARAERQVAPAAAAAVPPVVPTAALSPDLDASPGAAPVARLTDRDDTDGTGVRRVPLTPTDHGPASASPQRTTPPNTTGAPASSDPPAATAVDSTRSALVDGTPRPPVAQAAGPHEPSTTAAPADLLRSTPGGPSARTGSPDAGDLAEAVVRRLDDHRRRDRRDIPAAPGSIAGPGRTGRPTPAPTASATPDGAETERVEARTRPPASESTPWPAAPGRDATGPQVELGARTRPPTTSAPAPGAADTVIHRTPGLDADASTAPPLARRPHLVDDHPAAVRPTGPDASVPAEAPVTPRYRPTWQGEPDVTTQPARRGESSAVPVTGIPAATARDRTDGPAAGSPAPAAAPLTGGDRTDAVPRPDRRDTGRPGSPLDGASVRPTLAPAAPESAALAQSAPGAAGPGTGLGVTASGIERALERADVLRRSPATDRRSEVPEPAEARGRVPSDRAPVHERASTARPLPGAIEHHDPSAGLAGPIRRTVDLPTMLDPTPASRRAPGAPASATDTAAVTRRAGPPGEPTPTPAARLTEASAALRPGPPAARFAGREPAGENGRDDRFSVAGHTPTIAPERRFESVLRRTPAAPAPLPVQWRPLASAIAGERRVRVSTNAASRAALRAAGKRAATTGDVIHLAQPLRGTADAPLLAHELTHVANPSPAPRFFDDDRDSPEERRAAMIADVIRRSPVLPSSAAAATTSRMPAAPRLAPVRRAPAAPAGRSAEPSTTADDMVQRLTNGVSGARPGGRSEPVRRFIGEVPRPAPLGSRRPSTAGATGPGTVGAPSPSSVGSPFEADATASRPSGSPAHANDTGGRTAGQPDSDAIPRYSRNWPVLAMGTDTSSLLDLTDWIVEQVETRVMRELERRGGRYRGEF